MSLRDLESYSPRDHFYNLGDQLSHHVCARSEAAFAAGEAARDAIASAEQLAERRQRARQCLLDGIGGLPESDNPLSAQITGVVKADGYAIEKVIFESRPRNYVTANLYLPHARPARKSAAVLFLCGHHRDAKHQPEYQRVCIRLAHAGLIVLAQDPIGQGERFSYFEPSIGEPTIGWGTTEHDYAGQQCWPLGEGIARYFLHDSIRGLDYLAARPEVDPERIGLTGNSGGGTQASLLMLADFRIAAAAPATFIMDRRSYMLAGGAQDAEQIWPGFTSGGFDHEDILLAMAPKPVRVLAVTGDFFPIEGTRRTVERCKRVWQLLEQPGNLDLVEDDSSHAFTPKLARAAAEFFSRHLLGRDAPPDREPEALEPSRLWCTRSGQVRGEIPDAQFVHEIAQARSAELARARARRSQPERAAGDWLHGRVFRGRERCDLNPRYRDSRFEELAVTWALWRSQPDLFNFGYLFRRLDLADQTLPVTLALWRGGTRALRPHVGWIRETCGKSRAVVVLDVTGCGAIEPNPINAIPIDANYGTLHKLNDDLFFLDDDLAAMRVYDITRAIDMIAGWPGVSATATELYAEGRFVFLARAAALIDDRITAVRKPDGPHSAQEWVEARYYDAEDIKSFIIRGSLNWID